MATIFLVLSLILVSYAQEQNRGVSYIGLCHPRVSGADVLRVYDGTETINIHFLVRTFNPSGCPAFEAIAADPRPMVLHLSLINGPGLRNRRLQKYEFLRGMTVRTADAAIIRRSPKVLGQMEIAIAEAKRLVELRGDRTTVLRIKPVLESNFSPKARRTLSGMVKRAFPSAEIIDNPLGSKCLPGYLCETHGMDTSGDILDLDGLDYEEANRQKWEREGRQKVGMFIWKYCNNGFKRGDRWVPPLRRKNWCVSGDLRLFNYWMSAA
jgi:hypothetical protein